ncbi:hypothetical protein KUTeg_021086 [Tegillarca granosa]|uniref:Uncharacterized protein n=1 Tax=Tegillarca granosa TaxID=220873 RepID=A0ABQ9EC72_TEGGR|nr:hypothetical protein KUTeg_021086 [Tegillarca granosa]
MLYTTDVITVYSNGILMTLSSEIEICLLPEIKGKQYLKIINLHHHLGYYMQYKVQLIVEQKDDHINKYSKYKRNLYERKKEGESFKKEEDFCKQFPAASFEKKGFYKRIDKLRGTTP